MSGKLLWTGLTLIQAGLFFNMNPFTAKVGAAIMIVGLILLWLDK